jgi:hypothetical protein
MNNSPNVAPNANPFFETGTPGLSLFRKLGLNASQAVKDLYFAKEEYLKNLQEYVEAEILCKLKILGHLDPVEVRALTWKSCALRRGNLIMKGFDDWYAFRKGDKMEDIGNLFANMGFTDGADLLEN